MNRLAYLAVTSVLLSGLASATPALTSSLPNTPQQTTAPYEISHTFTSVGTTPHFTGIDDTFHKLYVSNLSAGTVTVVNTTNGQLIKSIHLGGTLHTVMVDQEAHRVYVTDIERNLLDVIDANKDMLVHDVAVSRMPHGLALAPMWHRIYVSSVGESKIDVVDSAIMKRIATIKVGPNPWGVATDRDTQTVFSANTGSLPDGTNNPKGNSVTEVDGRTNTVKRTVIVGPHPWNILVNPLTHRAYTGVSDANDVAVLADNSPVQHFAVGKSPHGLALDLTRQLLFVDNSGSNTVSVIDVKTNAVIQTVPVGKQPQGVSVDQQTGDVYVANQGDNTVTVLHPTKS